MKTHLTQHSAPQRKPLANAVNGAIRADSFKGLVHKLEGEGKSAQYAKAIAGKVNAEKHHDYHGGKKDAQPDDARSQADHHRANAEGKREVARLVNPRESARLGREASAHEGSAKDIEASELDAQPAEDQKMADVSEFRARLDKMREAIDAMCDALGGASGDDDVDEAVKDDADEEEEHEAGKELAKGKEDEEHGDEKEGEEDEHKAGEELAKGREDAESEAERSRAGKVARRHQLETERGDAESEEERSEASEEGHEHHDEKEDEGRGDKSPTELAEPITEADAMSHAEQVRIGKESHRDDSQPSDAEIRSKIAALEAKLSRAIRPVSREERDAMARAQARCDSVAQMFGLRAEPPLAGEHIDAYRRRLVAPLQKYSQASQKINVDRLDSATFDLVEERIYADAQTAARAPDDPTPGRLTPVRSVDAAGRTITRYFGDPDGWMAPFKARGLSIRINNQHHN